VGYVEGDGAPGRWWQAIDFGDETGRAPAQGEEGDTGGIEPVEPLVGGELSSGKKHLWKKSLRQCDESKRAKKAVARLAVSCWSV
jgi:hypothetical protein